MNETLLQYLLESGTGLLLLYLFYRLVLNRETCFQFNRFYLLAALFLSLAVPLSNLPGISLWPDKPEPVVVMEAPLEQMPLATAEVLVVAPQESFNYWNLLYGAYAIGVLFFLSRFLVQLYHLRRYARQEGVSFFLPNRAPVILTNGQYPTFSFWCWVFLDNSQALSPEETERILQHEQVHLDQRHTLDVLLVSLLGILFWFNPLLVFYKKALEQTHEFIADAQVAKSAGTSVYSSLLLKQVFQTADFPLGSYFFFNRSLTLTRIKMMKKLHQSPKLSRMLLVIPVLALLLVAVAAMRPVTATELPFADGDETEIAKVQNGPAQFPGGREALNTYVKSAFVLPEVAFQKRKSPNDFVQVKANLEVEVQPDGTPVYRRTLELDVQPNDAAVREAVEKQFARLVSQMPKWTPAQNNGRAISSKEIISVSSASGNFVNYASYLESRQQKTTVSSKAVAAAETKRAEYPGGKAAMYHYLINKFFTPEIVFSLDQGEKGIMFSRAIKAEISINEKGEVTNVRPLEVSTTPGNSLEINKAIEKEFLRVAKQMARWTPAYVNGKPVASKEVIGYSTGTLLWKDTYNQVREREKKIADRPYTPQKMDTFPKVTADGDKIYIAVEKMPEFPGGGQAAMFKYFNDKMYYPADAQQAKISGTLVASFVVTPQGKVTDVQLMKKLHPSLDQAFMKVVQNMPDWIPGTQNGKAVAVRYTVPFRVMEDAAAKGTNAGTNNEAEKVYVEVEKVYIAVEQMPDFPGGQSAMFRYLAENFVLPAEDKAKGTEGTIVLSFIVTTEGAVSKIEIMKGLSPVLDQEAVRVISSMPTWKPGMQNGKAVNVKYTVPYRIVVKKEVDKPAAAPAQNNR
jgi:TonB family protein